MVLERVGWVIVNTTNFFSASTKSKNLGQLKNICLLFSDPEFSGWVSKNIKNVRTKEVGLGVKWWVDC